MKTLKLIIVGMILFFSCQVMAQFSIRVNIGSPPRWGPVGYEEERYYYLPDVEAYYDVNSSMFIYYSGGSWVHRSYLPSRYRDYDLYSGYKVVLRGYRGETPYNDFNEHRRQYARGYRGESQRTIGERPGNYRGRMYSENRPSERGNRGNDKNEGHGNDQHMRGDQGHNGRDGKDDRNGRDGKDGDRGRRK